MLQTAPPLWASVSDLPENLQTDPVAAQEALEYASFVLWSLTGRMYNDPVSVIEAYDTRQSLAAGSTVYPMFLGGMPYNVVGCDSCPCSQCGVFHRTRLRGYPVQFISNVWVNGSLLAADEYVLLDYSVLGLKTGSACNATCLMVEYTYGAGLPPGGKNAVLKLAGELILSAQGAPCMLPERVTSVSRQGVSYTLLDPQDFLDKGRTGIYEIDLMLRAVNPAGALKRPRVFSPDIRRAEVQTYAAPPDVVPLGPSAQAVITGSPGQWVSQDAGLVRMVRSGASLTTEISDGSVLGGRWRLAITSDGRDYVTLDLAHVETQRMRRGMIYTVRDSTGMTVVTGEVQTF